MRQQVLAVAEFEVLATIAQRGEWIDLDPHWLSEPAAQALYGWMRMAREQTGLCSAIAVGAWMESQGYSDDCVDSAVDLLVETAPVFDQRNVLPVIGYLIEQHGKRTDREPLDVVIDKHRAGCALTDREIARLEGALRKQDKEDGNAR
jgi:hypothetical protein